MISSMTAWGVRDALSNWPRKGDTGVVIGEKHLYIYIHTQLVKFCIIFVVKVDTRLLGLSQSVTRARMHVLPSTAFAYIYYYTTTVKTARRKNRKNTYYTADTERRPWKMQIKYVNNCITDVDKIIIKKKTNSYTRLLDP